MATPARRATRRRLADRLHSVAIHLLRRVRVVDRASLLSGPALSTLSIVVYGGPLTLGALAQAEQVRAPTMTRQVQALERAGLVTVRPDPDDARRRLVTATAAGRRVLEAGRARRVAAVRELLEGLSPADLRDLGQGLDVLEAALSDARGSARESPGR